jgi:hypothetical protein
VLLGLAPLLAHLEQRLGQARRLQPRAAQVGDGGAAALEQLLLGVQAAEEGAVDDLRGGAGGLVGVGVVVVALVLAGGGGWVGGWGVLGGVAWVVCGVGVGRGSGSVEVVVVEGVG